MSFAKQSVSARASIGISKTPMAIQVRILEDQALHNSDILFTIEVIYKSDKWIVRRKFSEIILFLYCNIEIFSTFSITFDKNYANREHQENVAIATQYLKDIVEHFSSFFIQAAAFFDFALQGRTEEYMFRSQSLSSKIPCLRCGFMLANIYFTSPSTKPNLSDWKRYYVVVTDSVSFFENDVTFRNLGQSEYRIPLECFTVLPSTVSNDNFVEFQVVTDVAVLCFRVAPEEYGGWESIFSVLPDLC
jgi:hypothetical protein